MYYEINVALYDQHLFATARRSLTSQFDTEHCLEIFYRKFPESEGFSITVTRWEEKGHEMQFPVLKAKALSKG